jgi:hypothetical protein
MKDIQESRDYTYLNVFPVPDSLNVLLIISTYLNVFPFPDWLNVLLIISTYLNVFPVPDWLNVLRIILTYLNVFHVPDWLNVLLIISTYRNVFHVLDWLLDLWPNDPKVNRVLPLPQGNHVVKFGKDPIYRTKVIMWKWPCCQQLYL